MVGSPAALSSLLTRQRTPDSLRGAASRSSTPRRQQLTAVSDEAGAPTTHRCRIVRELRGAGDPPSLSGWTAASLSPPPASGHTCTRRAPTPGASTLAIHTGVSCADAPLPGAKWASTSYGSGWELPDRRFAHARSLLRTGSNPTATAAVAATDSRRLGRARTATEHTHDDHDRDVTAPTNTTRPARTSRCSRRRPRANDRHQPLISAVCSRLGDRDSP